MKRTLSVVLMLVLMLSCMTAFPLKTSADSLYIKKVVSVVYDDSGSMDDEHRYLYANYAMQTFCGMLNEEDKLYITYMTSPSQSTQIKLGASDIEKSLSDIRNSGTPSGGTPFTAVETAFTALKNVNDIDPNTQYWLVVITDGVFNEYSTSTEDAAIKALDEKFKGFTSESMTNGTKPQVTYLAIGSKVVSPNEDKEKGIFTYSAKDSNEITDTMSKLADKVSGRTRLDKNSVKITGDTVEVSSDVPLLNIAVLTQETEAVLQSVTHSNNKSLTIARAAKLNVDTRAVSGLYGGAYLIDNAQSHIEKGTYTLKFDKSVNADNVVVLFEPAIEMRMTITLNGKEISDYNELDDASENDKISIECKVYEMGTDNVIKPDLLPSDTEYKLSIIEDGKVAKEVTGSSLSIKDYVLKKQKTNITSEMILSGFNPITATVEFTPKEFVYVPTYTMEAALKDGIHSIKLDNVASNKDLAVCFTVSCDGTVMTDKSAVEALNPVVTAAPAGNAGETVVDDNGVIVFTPNKSALPANAGDSFNVDVSCTIDDGTTASATYTVLVANYAVVPVDTKDTIQKHKFFGNTVSASFYITKDNAKLGKADVEKEVSAVLNEEYKALKVKWSVANDGTITVTPYDEKEHKITFWNWWINWSYYFGLEGEDVTVSLNHKYGSASSVIEVVEADMSYLVLFVFIPLIIEIIALAFLITWIVLIIIKPKYSQSAKLYVGDIRFDKSRGIHILRNLSAVHLKRFNKIKKGNGRLKFKAKADVVSANGIKIRADKGGRIFCEMAFPWFKGKVEPCDSFTIVLKTPEEVMEYLSRHQRLEINEFVTTETVEGDYNRSLVPANPRNCKYIVIPDDANGVTIIDDRKVINQGKIIVYING